MTTTKNCETCGNTKGWHDNNPTHHEFNDGSVNVFSKRQPEAQTQTEMAWPFDPVLRQALIDKGVLTPEDLTVAERRIRAVTGQFLQEEAPHVPSTGQPGGPVV